MSITGFFERLGAPLANSRWSWGAQRASDGAVFLRVWQDLKKVDGGRRYLLLDLHHGVPGDPKNLGHQERLRHIEAVRGGARCYLVMCIAVDVQARPRTILDFHDADIFVGGELMEKDGSLWIEMAGRRPVSDVLPKRSSDEKQR